MFINCTEINNNNNNNSNNNNNNNNNDNYNNNHNNNNNINNNDFECRVYLKLCKVFSDQMFNLASNNLYSNL